jgi:hypothetical protein
MPYAEDYDQANGLITPHVDTYERDAAYPGYIAQGNGALNPQELFPQRPTGYLPHTDDLPQVPYDRAADEQGIQEYSDSTFPVELLDSSEQLDQHPFMHVTATITAPDDGPRRTGTRDPMISGPARPDTVLLSMFSYRGLGTDNNKYQDVPDGRVFSPYGSQDGSTWVVYQDPYEALAPLNTSEYPAPTDPSQNAKAQRTLAAIQPGPAHGWTEVPVVNDKQSINDKGKRQGFKQLPPKQDRKANSTVVGQSYSQVTASVTQSSSVASATTGPDDQWW